MCVVTGASAGDRVGLMKTEVDGVWCERLALMCLVHAAVKLDVRTGRRANPTVESLRLSNLGHPAFAGAGS
jgi:hypothetical protein